MLIGGLLDGRKVIVDDVGWSWRETAQ